MKYAWYSTSDQNRPYPSGFHTDEESLEKCIKKALECLGNPKEIIGAAEALTSFAWDNKPLSTKEIVEIVGTGGYCQFGPKSKNGWSRVETMDHYNEDQRLMLEAMEGHAQREADATGKQMIATSLGGLSVTAKPKKRKGGL
jgi:hypothetical protein